MLIANKWGSKDFDGINEILIGNVNKSLYNTS